VHRINENSLAMLDLTVTWHSPEALHVERFLARKVNFWRDILPPGLMVALIGKQAGDSASVSYPAGKIFPLRDEAVVRKIPLSGFKPAPCVGRTAAPRAGRFYPRGLFEGLPAVFPQDMRPARILDASDTHCLVDLNHPLADASVTLDATVLNVSDKISDTGGRLSHWMEEICDFGPGMQARRPGGEPTDFSPLSGNIRLDARDDSVFYREPRMIGHVDAQASELLKEAYMRVIPKGAKVLDLMSSLHSHLPGENTLDVTGLGMNATELEANPILNSHVVHDLNKEPTLPFDDCEFNAVVCSLSIEYLLNPVAILRECSRILKTKGQVLIGFSNRWFPTKAHSLWIDLHEFERMGLVLDYLGQAGGFADMWTYSARNWWRPVDDPHVRQTWTSDPVFVVGGTKR